MSSHPIARTENVRRANVFISYSHDDTRFLRELQVHLKPLERDGRIESWDDTRIKVGSNWSREIRDAIDRSRVAVLLVSASFLASDFIRENEVPPLLVAAERDGAVIMPVIVSPCLFTNVPELARFQSVNPPSNTLSEMTRAERNRIWVDLARAVEAALAE